MLTERRMRRGGPPPRPRIYDKGARGASCPRVFLRQFAGRGAHPSEGRAHTHTHTNGPRACVRGAGVA